PPAAAAGPLRAIREAGGPAPLPPALREALRRGLKAWSERQTGDTAAEQRIMAELRALLTPEDAPAIARTLTPEQLDTPFGQEVLKSWLQTDTPAAAAWIAAHPDPSEIQALLIARQWLQAPDKLGAFCDRLPDTGWKQTLLSTAGREALAADPAVAVSFARRMDPGPVQTDTLETIAWGWISRDSSAATTWISQIPDPAQREQLAAVAARAIALTDPDLAAGWLASSVKSPALLNATSLSLAQIWAGENPAQAAEWSTKIADPATRQAAINQVAKQWMEADTAAAEAWIRRRPEAPAIISALEAEQAAGDLADP
ncbi:MAG TPA: hypothetical protein VHC86_08510, partial [Opitutaceae bacterium]|nr:hypothetical protein [Opitutaceae bacterium]